MGPYGWYLGSYLIVVFLTNVGRYLKPGWYEGLGLAEAVAGGVIVVLAFRRLYRSGDLNLNLSGSIRATIEQIADTPPDPEEEARRQQRNARQRDRRAERRRELAQRELDHAQIAARIERAKPVEEKKPAEPSSKWDRLLDDKDDL